LFVSQDGIVTEEEEQALNWLEREAALEPGLTRPYKDAIQRIRRLAGYRAGHLPSLKSRLILESGERCHWQGECNYRYKTPSGQTRDAQGLLIITSKNIVLNSTAKALSFAPSRILDIRLYSNGVVLDLKGRTGNGFYKVEDPDELEAILTGFVRKHKYLLTESYSSAYSRHIPHEVKIEVWSRDAGKCVNCGATEYLEFDHIIPHAKGGANTVGNIQLLCRRCNNEKKDRI
jgi:hypothetical protein